MGDWTPALLIFSDIILHEYSLYVLLRLTMGWKWCKNSYISKMWQITCTYKASMVKCLSIPSIGTLDHTSTNTRSICWGHFSWLFMNTQLTWQSTVRSVESQLIFADNAIKCQLSVDQHLDRLSTDCQPKYWSKIDWDVNQGYHSTLGHRYL